MGQGVNISWSTESEMLCKHLTTEQSSINFLIMNENSDELGCKSRIVTESIFCKLSGIL